MNKQHNTRSGKTSGLNVGNIRFNTPQTILGAWADYFEGLATPSSMENFDENFLSIVKDDVDALTQIYVNKKQPIEEVTENDIKNCI